MAAYRIVTEAVTNALRHAGPSRVTVTMTVEDADLVLRIRDDGHGVQPGAVPGIGLTSMEERAAEVGGAFRIDSGADGTTVTATLPVQGAVLPGGPLPDSSVRDSSVRNTDVAGEPEAERTPAP